MKLKKINLNERYVTYHSRFGRYRIEWYYGNICNERCSYCLNNNTYSQYYRDMSKEETEKVVKFINEFPIPLFEVSFIGGEPSCFKYFFYAFDKIKRRCRFNVLSNGEDEEWVEKLLSKASKQHPVFLCITPHYEPYLRDKERYMEHLNRIMHLSKKYKYTRIEFNLLLDGEKTRQYKEMFEYIIHNKKKFGYTLCASYVRRTRDSKEVVKNFAITTIFDDETREFMQRDFRGERLEYLRKNSHCGEICPIYENYCFIRLDGRLEATGCEQEIITNKSIFDDDFDLEIEKKNLKQNCRCKRQPNNGLCNHVHGLPPD